MDDLQHARYEEALRTIERFGPVPEKPRTPHRGRDQLYQWVREHHASLRMARTEELVRIVAIIEQVEARSV